MRQLCLHHSHELFPNWSTHINHCICQNHPTSNTEVWLFLLPCIGFCLLWCFCLQFSLVFRVISFNSIAPCSLSVPHRRESWWGWRILHSATCCFRYRPAFESSQHSEAGVSNWFNIHLYVQFLQPRHLKYIPAWTGCASQLICTAGVC